MYQRPSSLAYKEFCNLFASARLFFSDHLREPLRELLYITLRFKLKITSFIATLLRGPRLFYQAPFPPFLQGKKLEKDPDYIGIGPRNCDDAYMLSQHRQRGLLNYEVR